MSQSAATNPEEFRASSPELLVDLADKVAQRLMVALGLASNEALAIGIEIATEMARDWGGQVIYMPKGCSLEVLQRHLAIYQEFNGRNHAELAAKHDMTVPAIYRILKTVGRREMAKRQGDMFASETSE